MQRRVERNRPIKNALTACDLAPPYVKFLSRCAGLSRLRLFWINADTALPDKSARMVLFRHQLSAAAGESGHVPDTAKLPVPAESHDLAIPVAWPVGASQLAIAHEVVRRDKDVEVRSDWVVSAK